MRKVILDLATTLDGFIEGPNGETDWCIMDDDMDFPGFLETIDTIFYGRVSYDTWGNFQPDSKAQEWEKELWSNIHNKRKYVFSTQMRQDSNATYIHSEIERNVSEIKKQMGKDIWLYGGASLISSFVNLELIDTYRISVHPIILGQGKALFEHIKQPVKLRLNRTNVFRSGVVQLIYMKEINSSLK